MSLPVSRRRAELAAIFGAGVAMLAVTVLVTLAGLLRGSDPATAHRIVPFDARAAAAIAYQGATTVPEKWARWDSLAAQALRRDPTAVLAAVSRGIIAGQRGDAASSSRWFRYSDRLSRRDLTTQLWFIEQRVQAGDVRGALARYDVALRASPSASPLLYPILAQAASTPAVAVALNTLLRSRPAWGTSFIDHLIQRSNDARTIVGVTSGVINHDPVNGERQLTALIARLVSAGQYDLAWRAYLDFGRPKSGESMVVHDGSFASPAPISAFEWIYADPVPLSPERGLEGERSVLYLPANPDRDGVTARQLVRFPGGGRWRLGALTGFSEQSAADAPRLTLRCATTPNQLLIDLPFLPSSSRSALAGDFTVSESCRYAWLSITVRQPSEPTKQVRPYISDISLRRR